MSPSPLSAAEARAYSAATAAHHVDKAERILGDIPEREAYSGRVRLVAATAHATLALYWQRESQRDPILIRRRANPREEQT